MMDTNGFWRERSPRLFRGDLNPPRGALGSLLQRHGAEVVICHPTYRNADNIGRQLADGVRGAVRNFPGKRVAFVVSDGTYTAANPDSSTLEAAERGAREALGSVEGDDVLVVVTPYEGYLGDRTPGKGSALKLVYEELAFCDARILMLMDGDLRNDMGSWQRVFADVAEDHFRRYPGKEFFVTPRYARHFVDASLTRFIVGPLTTLMGMFVPGGIAGDICLSAGAVARERGPWIEARRKYGTDISTTFDNLASGDTMVYEVYLGAKLHDITDESKLSIMPGEVIGAALERILHYGGLILDNIQASDLKLGRPVYRGPDQTGIGFVDPGYTDAFNVDLKLHSLMDRWAEFKKDVDWLLGTAEMYRIDKAVVQLKHYVREKKGPLRFLGITRPRWIGFLYTAVARVLRREPHEPIKRALNYLYTAAFLEFCLERLHDLGLYDYEEIVRVQHRLGADPDQAEEFYEKRVDGEAFRMAEEFFTSRHWIVNLMETLPRH